MALAPLLARWLGEPPVESLRPWRPVEGAVVAEPWPILFAISACAVAGIWVGPGRIRSSMVPIAVALTFYALQQTSAEAFSAHMRPTFSSMWALRVIALFWSSDVETFRRDGEAEAPEARTWARLRWAIDLWWTTRGVGWTWRAPHLKISTETRRQFLLRAGRNLVVLYFLLDFIVAAESYNPYLISRGAMSFGTCLDIGRSSASSLPPFASTSSFSPSTMSPHSSS